MALKFDGKPGELEQAIINMQIPIAKAATAAIRGVGRIAVKETKSSIAAAGLGSQLSRGMRVKFDPPKGYSLEPSALIFNKFGFISVFEFGATITGRPFLWLPLPAVPKAKGRQLTPAQFAARFGKLITINRPGKPPMLGARVPVSRSGKIAKLTTRSLKPSTRPTKAARVIVVPMFVGVPQVSIRKRTDIHSIINRAADLIGTLYLTNLEVD